MKAANQGFIDLHSPLGFFAIGMAFLLLTMVIIAGGIYGKALSVREREVRRKLKEELQSSEGIETPPEARL